MCPHLTEPIVNDVITEIFRLPPAEMKIMLVQFCLLLEGNDPMSKVNLRQWGNYTSNYLDVLLCRLRQRQQLWEAIARDMP